MPHNGPRRARRLDPPLLTEGPLSGCVYVVTVGKIREDGIVESTTIGHNLVRLGPPSKGDTIHKAECRFAQRPNALHWNWAEGRPLHEWVIGAPWLKPCQVCRPDLPRDTDNAS
jgi:hypothetical protein